MAWVTPEELRAHLRLPSIDTDAATVTIAEAEDTIRADLGQTIDAVTGGVAELVGNGRHVLLLPQMPVTGVASVAVDGEELETDAYRWNRHGILTRFHGRWPLDAEVTAVYDHGWTPIPAAVKRVCKQVAGRAWLSPSGLYASESLGDRSVTYARGSDGRPVTGDALTEYEQQLLDPYRRSPNSK
ncbi:hypothetical protein [Streptomyces sp. URMC 129]|uniref:hypothetical protein n=1 Tax=Streptomyces sp. URMC 129 TaxID=3423407 RepID=UPI003F1CDC6C